MNLLFLADRFLPHAGGSRVYYYNIYRRLSALHNDTVTVLTKRVPGWEQFDAKEADPNFVVIRRSDPLGDWKFHQIHTIGLPALHTFSLIRKNRPDMIHVGDLYPQGLLGLLCRGTLGIPYLAYCHGEEVTQMDHFRLESKLRNAVYQNAAVVVSASAFARQNLIRIGIPEDRIVTVTPGVDHGRFTPGRPSDSLVERLGLQGKIVLLTVARLVPRKGHAVVMKALAKLAADIPDLCYVVVGTGPQEESLRRLARECSIEQLVKFAGYVPAEDLPDYYRACDIFVMMNCEEHGDIEGFGMVFLEANAAGKPVIGGRSGGTEESIREGFTGYRCDPHDVDATAAKIAILAKQPRLRLELGEQARAWVTREFDWGGRASLVRAASASVVGKRGRSLECLT